MWAGRQSLRLMQPSSCVPGSAASYIRFLCVAGTSVVFHQVATSINSEQEGFPSIHLRATLLKMFNQKWLTPAYLRAAFPVGPALVGSGWQEGRRSGECENGRLVLSSLPSQLKYPTVGDDQLQ